MFKRELRREVEALPSKTGVANNELTRSQKARSGQPHSCWEEDDSGSSGWGWVSSLLDGELRET